MTFDEGVASRGRRQRAVRSRDWLKCVHAIICRWVATTADSQQNKV
jgi:hypothetical protein